MPKQMDWTEAGETPAKPKRTRRKPGSTPPPGDRRGDPEGSGAPSEPEGSPQGATETPRPAAGPAETAELADVAHLKKKGLRVVPVVTGAVVDASGNFLFYVDGHDDARSGVQAQLNHILECGPSREEHLAPARARAREVLDKLSRPRGG